MLILRVLHLISTFDIKTHLVEFKKSVKELAILPAQVVSNPQSKEMNQKWIGLFSNASFGWLGQINDGASRYKGGAGVRKAANGHICNKPNQKCNKCNNGHIFNQPKPEM